MKQSISLLPECKIPWTKSCNNDHDKIAPQEVPTPLKDALFHCVKKNVMNNIKHQYYNPNTIYSALVVATRKAEGAAEVEISSKPKQN